MGKKKQKNKEAKKNKAGNTGPLKILTENAEFTSRARQVDLDSVGSQTVQIKEHLLPKEPPQYKTNGKLKTQYYERELTRLQEELVKLQYWVSEQGLRVVIVFEGRSGAGKGGVIKRIMERTSRRIVRVVALPTPSDREKTQWWFQKYVTHLPAGGEIAFRWFNSDKPDRSPGGN